MDDRLQSLISKATERIQAAKNDREADELRDETQKLKQNAERFKQIVQTALGPEILEALGPVTFDEALIQPAMRFERAGRTFQIKTVGGPVGLAQLEEVTQAGFSSVAHHIQFNLLRTADA